MREALWSDKSIASATGAKVTGSWQATGVSIDTRTIEQGDLFVALKGENFDGNDYAEDALKKGAAAAIISRVGAVSGGNTALVGDVQKALEDMGKYSRELSGAKFIGITGSVGKTSAKEAARLAFGALGETYASAGNLNNHIGVPLNLARMPSSPKFAIFEMGMNHAGEIASLTRQVRPHVAIITTVDAVHLEFFDSVEGIAKAKAEIFEGVEEGGAAIINADNPYAGILRKRAGECGISRIYTFGESKNATMRLLDFEETSEGCRVVAGFEGGTLDYITGCRSKHLALNTLAVLAAVHALGGDVRKAAAALREFKEGDGRGGITRIAFGGGEITLIDDSYNASPASVKAAIQSMRRFKQSGSRLVVALGDMLELGVSAPALHSMLAKDVAECGIELAFTAGTLMKNLHDSLPAQINKVHFGDYKEMMEGIKEWLKPGDVLLVKGSHGSKMYEVARFLKMRERSAA